MRAKKTLLLILCATVATTAFSQPTLTNLRTADGTIGQYLMRAQHNNLDVAESSKAITSFNNAPNTTGKRFLFDTWVQGDSIVLSDNQLMPAAEYLFNYDKQTGSLIATENKENIVAASTAEVQSFILKAQGKTYRFVKLEKGGSSRFYLELANAPQGFAVYRHTRALFTRADFHTDGITQSGSRDDEYKDEHDYIVADNTSGKMVPVQLRAKSIKQVFAKRKSEVQGFFRNNWDKHIDESFLVGLVNSLNAN